MISMTFSVRLTQAEREALKRLAQETGRTPAGVLRRLLALADLPENRRALGSPSVGDHGRRYYEVRDD